MVICRYVILSVLFIIYNTAVLADFKKLNKIDISTIDFLLIKFDNFFIKNQHKILGVNPLAVRYESVNYYVLYEKEKKIEIFLEAVMERVRYKNKKYYPKHADCNIVRNRIFFNKFGYSAIKRKFNYTIDEDLMRTVLKNTIYNLENLNDELKDFLIDKTTIKVEIIHPKKNKNYLCSGNLVDVELR